MVGRPRKLEGTLVHVYRSLRSACHQVTLKGEELGCLGIENTGLMIHRSTLAPQSTFYLEQQRESFLPCLQIVFVSCGIDGVSQHPETEGLESPKGLKLSGRRLSAYVLFADLVWRYNAH